MKFKHKKVTFKKLFAFIEGNERENEVLMEQEVEIYYDFWSL
jgi:hypothetical protein